ncbi:hypothetical protein JAAARDRAFT_30960 [Jaapia argillacea MUCL 33604]|uniref:VPS9 domain-containing protein n=1 Tax=Jaapia argillacea MUCL 33604 TaxID=933084 RepID=A0A067QDE6_9AGAM|nr:hypothetical protein JAAARDRAFT_30960 [Jaapia argillacea MUCL 33604]
MDSSRQAEAGLASSLNTLHIADPSQASALGGGHHDLNNANPWHDDPDTCPQNPPAPIPVSYPDLSSIEAEALRSGIGEHIDGVVENEESPRRVSAEVLNEFDPLVADHEEKAAREAWEQSESHPPPPPSKSPPPQVPSRPETPTFSQSFPSLAALARTFALPLPRNRPRSLDTAAAVPSPGTLSSFAAQQQHPPLEEEEQLRQGSEERSNGKQREEGKDLPFDFQRFLDQMKMKGAEPVAKFLKSFLSNFAKRTFTVNDQVKLIHDFLNFISVKMREADIWRHASDAEFDNAMEGMEKLVMNRLYDFTFTPAVVRMIPPRPVTADDLERDRVLSQRIALFGWIEEKHLDVPEAEGSKGFLMFAEQELLKINHYKAPRDKLICILNCCKVIFGLLRHLRHEENADSFLPVLIFVVLKANPQHLLSNVEFINRFRNPAKLQSEAGYYLSSLMGAVSFIETMDHTSLSNITQEDFEGNVEEAIHHLPTSEPETPISEPSTPKRFSEKGFSDAPMSPNAGEEAAQPLSLPAPGTSLSEDARRLLQKTGDTISKPLNAISKIFSEALDNADSKLSYLPGPFAPFEIGRENRESQEGGRPPAPAWPHPQYIGQNAVPQTPVGVGNSGQQLGSYAPPLQTPYKPRVRRVPSPLSAQSTGSQTFSPDNTPTRGAPYTNQSLAIGPSQSLPSLYPTPPRIQSLAQSESEGAHLSRTPTPNLDFAGIEAEIDRAHERAAIAARETLTQMFPDVDMEIMDWVLEANEGDLGKSIEALLEMSSGD